MIRAESSVALLEEVPMNSKKMWIITPSLFLKTPPTLVRLVFPFEAPSKLNFSGTNVGGDQVDGLCTGGGGRLRLGAEREERFQLARMIFPPRGVY